MADAIFDSSGNVSGGNGGRRISAWSGTGQGIANLLAPSTSGIASAGSLLPADSEMGRAIRQTPRYSYPENINNYAKIMADAYARAAQQAQSSELAALRSEIEALKSQPRQQQLSPLQRLKAERPLLYQHYKGSGIAGARGWR